MIAALFVQKAGCYAGLPSVDAWDESRDARLYQGPHPVIAHPPCQRYGALGFANWKRWGGEHNRPANDSGCFASALASVNCWGGVLEHPANSLAWPMYNLVRPVPDCWTASGLGWVCEVWQSAYGHKANKRTWLYYRGGSEPFAMRWDRPVGSHQVGYWDHRGKDANKPTLTKTEANATPIEFRDTLIDLVSRSKEGK
jgi:hypothetical protein